MSEQDMIHSPAHKPREDARDLQSRLYREIGLAAVEAELFAAERAPVKPIELRRVRDGALILRSSRAA